VALPIGMCQAWTPVFTCALPTGSEAVSGIAAELATETLYGLSGRQFGLCELTIRPCRRDCFESTFGGAGQWWEYGHYPQPALLRGLWYNLGCGGCAGECSCTVIHETILPGPVHEVTEVKVDGVVLTPDVDYRVDNYRLLVRLGGDMWPLCNDLNRPDTESGTWSVTFNTGQPVPTMGQVAAGIMTAEFSKMLLCESDCALPFNVTSLSRQGVDITLLDPVEIFENRRTGLFIPDLFINTYNPEGLRQRSRVYDIDAPYPRRTNT
jgi:hypothetical protein